MPNAPPMPGAIREKCAAVRHPQHIMKRKPIANGTYQYVLWCDRCRRVVTSEIDAQRRPLLSKAEAMSRLAPDASLEDIPVLVTEGVIRQCYACDAFAYCEDDHTAERTIHGELAERLPIVPLCPKCHGLKTKNLQDYIKKLRGDHAA
jgi:hypothetical protein